MLLRNSTIGDDDVDDGHSLITQWLLHPNMNIRENGDNSHSLEVESTKIMTMSLPDSRISEGHGDSHSNSPIRENYASVVP